MMFYSLEARDHPVHPLIFVDEEAEGQTPKETVQGHTGQGVNSLIKP